MDENASYGAASQEEHKTILGVSRKEKIQRDLGDTHRNEKAGMGTGLYWLEVRVEEFIDHGLPLPIMFRLFELVVVYPMIRHSISASLFADLT